MKFYMVQADSLNPEVIWFWRLLAGKLNESPKGLRGQGVSWVTAIITQKMLAVKGLLAESVQ